MEKNRKTMWFSVRSQPIINCGDSSRAAFGAVRILFGLIWLVNTYLQSDPAYSTGFLGTFSAAWATGQPTWLALYGHWMANLVQQLGAIHIATATVVIDAVFAISLITGVGLPFLAWMGVIYNLWLWSTVGGLGGPYTQGATDPGTAVVYAFCFMMVIWTRSWEGLSLIRRTLRPVSPVSMQTARILFGLLWAFDTFWKWHPYFLTHALTYLQQAQTGQPAWIVAYIGFIIVVINFVGPVIFGVFAAVMETILAMTLLFGCGLKLFIPIGIVYSIGIWTTAEGWGGPYTAGATGSGGNTLGTANIYVIAYLFLAVWVYFVPHKIQTGPGKC